jgi:hypothetical protein
MSTEKLSQPKNKADSELQKSLLSHHAFRMQCGSADEFKSALKSIVEELEEGGTTVDVWSRTYESLGVGDKNKGERFIEEICDRARDAAQGIRLVAVFAARINREAQNALLKTLEEPPLSTKIIIATPSPEALLPTIISRTLVLEAEHIKETLIVEAKLLKFSAMPKAKRLEYIKDIVEDKKIAEARALVLGLLDEVALLDISAARRVALQRELLSLDRELEGGASMLKMLLETAVLIVL